MKLRPLVVPAILLTVTGGLFAWLLLSDPPDISKGQSAGAARDSSTQVAASSPNALQKAPERLTSAAPLPADIRNVSPEGVTAPKVSGNLKRVEPSKRYLELKDPPVEPIPDGPIELTRVQVLDSGRIQSNRLVVTLAYIQPLKIDETCISRLGGSWPCGARARTFLRGLIRQFKITCIKIEEIGPGQILGSCRRGNVDLSARLVRYGWADPAPGAPSHITELAQKAKDRKIGKWQSEWLTDLPKSNWEGDATAALPGLEYLEPEIVEWSLRSDREKPDQDPFPLELDTPEDQRPQ
ncbi:thermonuclease family protein [Roseibium marinum]|uniref:Endonuclease YncB(Thermonuclease family) n=1 Tax=Roseibium marinum TaxID=281252 RepID=A0A2S3V4W3_9HYPH|nr:thermonuclease family protein [Roseibium marinum]POF34910.1 endonuclease YncB(thermonuclease family) [Roseibium marinum]